jgi:hypothetical protein
MTIIQDANRTRASRAHSAPSEHSAEPCTATPRARILPDVMAVRPFARMTCCETETGPDSAGKSAGRVRLLARLIGHRHRGRERPPAPMTRGRTDHATPGSFTPRSRPTHWTRTPSDGIRRRPISTTRRAQPVVAQCLFPQRGREVLADGRRRSAWLFEWWGTSSFPALVPT